MCAILGVFTAGTLHTDHLVTVDLDVHTSGDQRMPKNLQKSCVTAWWEALAVQMRSLRWCRSRFDVRIVTNHNHHFSGSINDFANQKNR